MNVETPTNNHSEQPRFLLEYEAVCGQGPLPTSSPEGILYRTVHVFVFNSRGELLISQRSAGKDRYPLCYTSSASKDLSPGDDIERAAARDLQKTLGLVAPLEFLGSLAIVPENANEHTCLYATCTDDHPFPDEREIESIEFVDIERLSRRCKSTPRKYTPAFRLLFDWYRAHGHARRTRQFNAGRKPAK